MWTRTSRVTGTQLTVARARELELDPENGLQGPMEWVTVCEAQATLIYSDTRKQAEQTSGLDFCDDCREASKVGQS